MDKKALAGEATLILSQSFDEGWRAYEVRKCQIENKIQELFPFLFGKEIKEPARNATHSVAGGHVLVNNR